MTQTLDTFDELAAIFLTEGEDTVTPEPSAPAQLEIVLVGHLPVRAGLWLTPYADAWARQRGPTTLIDLDNELPRVQLLRHPAEATGRSDWPGLRNAVDMLARDTRCWVIRPPHDAGMDQLIAIDGAPVTILSATSQTAVVHAYRLIRSLVDAARRAGRPVPDLGVALVGADPHEAGEVGTRLVNAASTFLDVPLALRRCLPRIDAGVISSGELGLAEAPVPDAATVVDWIRRSPRRTASRPEVNGRTPEPAPASPAPQAPQAPQEPAAESPRPPIGIWADDDERVRVIAGEGAPAKLTPKTVTFVEPKTSRAPAQPEERGRPVPLARFVEGLIPVSARCPRLERIELAVDDAGRLHLLGREADLRDMRVVEAWARDHRELLDQASRPNRIDACVHPVCHVFTDVPVTLADLHPSDLKLHVLTPVRVDDRVAWYCAPLK